MIPETKVDCISSAQKSFLENSWDNALNEARSWTGALLKAEAEDPKLLPPSEMHVKRFESTEVDIQ